MPSAATESAPKRGLTYVSATPVTLLPNGEELPTNTPRFTPEPARIPTGPPVVVTLSTGRVQRWADVATLLKAADRGDRVALAAHGQLLLHGKTIPKDSELAVIVLERAAAAGSADAAHLLSGIYDEGTLVVADPAKALAYAEQAVEAARWFRSTMRARSTQMAAGHRAISRKRSLGCSSRSIIGSITGKRSRFRSGSQRISPVN